MQSRILWALLCLCSVSALQPPIALAQQGTEISNVGGDIDELIGSTAYFPQRLRWVGPLAPSSRDSTQLRDTLEMMWSSDPRIWEPFVEQWAVSRPESPWTPSLATSLAQHYREIGRYTRALELWEYAWDLLKRYDGEEADRVKAQTLAHWTQLLSRLGRVDRLRALHELIGEAELDGGPFQVQFQRSREAMEVMITKPGRAYRCGSLALYNVAKRLGASEETLAELVELPSPETGFSLKSLIELGETYELNLMPVRGRNARAISVPSLVHWKSDHYAAIVEEREDAYLVVDPTFGEQRWLRKEIVEEEASGYFLIPNANEDRSKFFDVSLPSAAGVYGRGYAESFADDDDESECPTTEFESGDAMNPDAPNASIDPNVVGNCEDCPAPSSSGGSGGGCGLGMAIWRVSEPFVSLWVTDTPVFYTTSTGRLKSYTVSYKQRTDRDSDYVFGLGTKWESSFLSYVKVPSGGGGSGSTVSLWVPGGGKRNYRADGATYGRKSYTTMVYSSGNYTVSERRGASNVYGYAQTLGTGEKRYFMTEKKDRHGRTTTYSYSVVSGSVHLTSVTDPDGATTTFTYGTGAHIHRITGISAPYTRSATLAYNASGDLTSITDAESMTSSFGYSSGFLNSLTTPYGTTAFTLAANLTIDPGNPDYDDNRVIRAIFATHPNNSRELWMFRNNAAKIHETGATLMPSYTGSEIPEVDTAFVPNWSDSGMHENNSFYWAPRQYSLLNATFRTSQNFSDMTVSDYKRSRIRNWLLVGPSYAVSNTVNMERLSSNDGSAWGQTTWYDYDGKSTQEWYEGAQFLPRYIATRLPNADSIYTRYVRRADGQPTSMVEGWEDGGSSSDGVKTWQYSYNANNQLDWAKGPDGVKTVEYTYNADKKITTVKRYRSSTLFDTTTYTYDTKKRVATIDFPTGLKKDISYLNTNDFWISYVYYKKAVGTVLGTETFTYLNGEPRTFTDLRGLTRTNTYDKLSRIKEIDYPDGTDIEIQYNKLNISRVRDRFDEWTSYGYNNMGWMTSSTNRLNRVTNYTYCDCGALEEISNPLGDTITFGYDNVGRLTTTAYESGPTMTRSYDSAWRLLSVADGQGTVGYDYDDYGRLSQVKVNGTTVTTYTFDDYDRPSKIVNDGVENRYSYDQQNRMLTRTLERGSEDGLEEWVYAASGLSSYKFYETASQSWTTTYGRDEFGRTTSVVEPVKTGVTQTNVFTYNVAGDLLTLTDPAGSQTSWVYDTQGRKTQKKDNANTIIETYAWNVNSWMTNQWTLAKGTTYYTHDKEGNVTFVNYPSGTTDVTYVYDHANQLTSMTDALGTTTFNYNASGNLAYEDGPWASDRVTYGYTHGRRTSLALQRPSASDWSMSYTYDSSLRLDAITSPAGTFDYRYVGAERRIDEIGLPGTLKIDYAYTSVDKRLSDTWMKYGAVIKNRHSYGYNVAGWKTSHTLPSGATATLAHDALGQLTDADNYHSTNFDYAYDNGRNLDFRKINGVTEDFSVNALNQLTSSPLGTPTHDTNGNMTYDGSSTYTYDHANRLTQVKYQTGADHWRETYTYDGLSRLRKVYTEHSTNGTTWTFSSEVRLICDGRLAIQERNASNAVLATYTRGADISGSLQGAGGIGGILAREWSSNIAFYHSDAGGNVTQLVNSSGTVMASYQYDPYGMLVSQSGTWADENPYLFSSKRFLGDSLYDFGFRFYHADLQRWLNRDPMGEAGGINLYSYVQNGPLTYLDPHGLRPFQDHVNIIVNGYIGGFLGSCVDQTVDIGRQTLHDMNPANWQGIIEANQDRLADAFVAGDIGGIGLALGQAGIDATSMVAPWAKGLSAGKNCLFARGRGGDDLVRVRSYTDDIGKEGISSDGYLRADSWVTLPEEIPNRAGHLQIEKILEIEPGRGSHYIDFDVPRSNLRVPDNGTHTSGGAIQYQLNNATDINPREFRRPPGRPRRR